MKTYKFELTIKEGNDEFWEAIGSNQSGCDEVRGLLLCMLADYGFHAENSCLVLREYREDK